MDNIRWVLGTRLMIPHFTVIKLKDSAPQEKNKKLLINLSNGYFFTHVMVVNLGEAHGRQPDGMLRAYHGGGHRWDTIGHWWDTMVWWTLHGVVDTLVRPGGQPHDFEIQPRQSLRMWRWNLFLWSRKTIKIVSLTKGHQGRLDMASRLCVNLVIHQSTNINHMEDNALLVIHQCTIG